MTQYFRITGYSPEENFCFILDSNGKFEKLWEFSSYVISKGCKVLEVSTDERFIDINIKKVEEDKENVFLRANAAGRPNYIDVTIDGVSYKAVEVEGKQYIP